MTRYSVLDLAPITEGGSPAQSFANSLDLARHAERWGYNRFWLAEHHGMPGIASAATAVLIGHVAGGTSTIRVGAGGIMLPNHSPLVIAEQFATLESLYPGRIDLGLGRAPGSDQMTARALRRNLASDADEFPQDVVELADFLSDEPRQAVRAVPGAGTNVPLWILGSSLYGAQVAAALGLPYAFASHFAPQQMMQAIALYRQQFRPSSRLRQALRDARLQRVCRRQRRGSGTARHLCPAGLRQPAQRPPVDAAAAARRLPGDARAATPCAARAGSLVLGDRRTGDRAHPHRRASSSAPAPTN